MTPKGAAVALAAYAATIARGVALRDRTALDRWQARRLSNWLSEHAEGADLSDLPVMDRSSLLADFALLNQLGLSAEDATAMAQGQLQASPGYHAGLSTGTSGGVRMPYLISERERFVWLGTILAKVLGPLALKRPRVAVALPQGSSLYDAAVDGRAVPLCFVSLAKGFAAAAAQLEHFKPDVLVAPPRMLRWLAEQRATIDPDHIVSAAELLEPPERTAIQSGFPGVRLGEVYMATEGLFAVACRHGTLHLIEDRVHFDLSISDGGCVEPVITDFTRSAQRMARYRTGDLLRVVTCPCRSPMRAVTVAGRAADRIEGIAPDRLRDAVLAAGAEDFRLIQRGDSDPVLTTAQPAPAAQTALETLLRRPVRAEIRPLALPETSKLRRVMRVP